MKAGFGNRLNWLLTGLTTVLLLVSLLALTGYFQTIFRPLIEPELEKHAETVGSYVIAQIDRAVELDIPVPELVGVSDLMDDVLSANPDISYLALTDQSGGILHFSGPGEVRNADPFVGLVRAPDGAGVLDGTYTNTMLPILKDGQPVALLQVGMRADHVQNAMNEVRFDLLSILIVAALFNFEILILVIATAFSARIRDLASSIGRAASGDFTIVASARGSDEVARVSAAVNRLLDSVRREFDRVASSVVGQGAEVLKQVKGSFGQTSHSVAPSSARAVAVLRFAVFVFSLAEELTRTFLSVYIKDLFEPVPWLPAEVVIGAPIGLFMLLWAIAQPIAGSVSERRGRQITFTIGALLSAAGLAGSGLAQDLVQLMVARSVTAVGYAAVFIAAQGLVIDNTDPRERAHSMAIYAGGILAAGVCGPAIGGILADRVGFRITFLISAVLALIAGALIYRLVTERRERPAAGTSRGLRLGDIGVFMRNPRFIGVAVFSALPTKFGLTALMFFLLPLYLNQIGIGQAMVGRIMLLYWLLMIVVSPVAARLSDRIGKRQIFLGAGGVLAVGSAVLLSMNFALWPVILGTVVLGVAHALVGSPQIALLSEVCSEERKRLGETTVIGIFRLIERCGSVLAPFVAGWFLAMYGYAGAIQGIAAVLAGCVILLFVTMVVFRPRGTIEVQEVGR
jgi:MFS family permease/HAMP domain-containing protein